MGKPISPQTVKIAATNTENPRFGFSESRFSEEIMGGGGGKLGFGNQKTKGARRTGFLGNHFSKPQIMAKNVLPNDLSIIEEHIIMYIIIKDLNLLLIYKKRS